MTLPLSLRTPLRWLAACGVSLAIASNAFAHATPSSRDPAPNAQVAAPSVVTIHFSEPLEPAFSKIVLVDANGKPAASAASQVDARDRKTMQLAMQPLEPGRYTVQWTAVAEDGHRTKGSYAFSVK
ncbi:copper homeostasis periplasmic binding protein CopC [Paraburkholderia azotifigens]|uniref:Copper homeostasis periplasmic binding protein CopC n=1 Tax=Paraburkholderia azotifigens TaxID=2057004 RepID=A0A5C6VQD4_9BURK|nr:copper homeostasis periplasmic binding protein CopC [Paraburkholderia azotifigens]TXC87662.1 copper homeostasis periplasmic binding protein CopC [Paraburkholderia azotifigens]